MGDAAHGAAGHTRGIYGALTLALVSLSWMLGVGTLAGAPLGPSAVALVIGCAVASSVIGGLMVALMARAPANVTAPLSSLAVIHAALAVHLLTQTAASVSETWAMLSLATTLAGVLLVAASLVRVSLLVRYLPLPVTIGFVCGIGVLLVVSEVPAWLGVPPGAAGGLADVIEGARLQPFIVGAVALAITWYAPRAGFGAVGPLLAICAATGMHHVLAPLSGPQHIGPTLRGVEIGTAVEWSWNALLSHVGPDWLLPAVREVLPFAGLIAFQCVMNATLTTASLPSIMSPRRGVDRVLRAQGVANVVCGMIGCLPVGTNVPLSLMSVRLAPAPLMIALCCAFMLVLSVGAVGVLHALPLAAFAGVLIVSGLRMLDPRVLSLALHLADGHEREATCFDLFTIAVVAGLFAAGHAGLGVLCGMLIESGRAWRERRHVAHLTFHHGAAGAPAQPTAIVRLRGVLHFGNAHRLRGDLSRLPEGLHTLLLDLSGLLKADLSASYLLLQELARMRAGGIQVGVAGVPARCVRLDRMLRDAQHLRVYDDLPSAVSTLAPWSQTDAQALEPMAARLG